MQVSAFDNSFGVNPLVRVALMFLKLERRGYSTTIVRVIVFVISDREAIDLVMS